MRHAPKHEADGASAAQVAPATVQYVFDAAQLECYTTRLAVGDGSWRLPLSEACAARSQDRLDSEVRLPAFDLFLRRSVSLPGWSTSVRVHHVV